MTSATIGSARTNWRVRPIPVRTPPPLTIVAPAPADVADPGGGAIQGTLDLRMPRERTALRVVGDERVGPAPTPLAQLPDPKIFAARIAVLLLEVISGGRPLTHVGRVTSPEVYASLERRRICSKAAGTRMRPVRVRRVVGGSPTEGVFEAAVVVVDQRRVRAMALRLFGQDGRWLVTELGLT